MTTFYLKCKIKTDINKNYFNILNTTLKFLKSILLVILSFRYLDMEREMWEKEKMFMENCDYCGELGLGGHRCYKCHTKVYCGQECYDADLSVHKETCKPKEEMDAWKIRENYRGRKDEMKNSRQELCDRSAETIKNNIQTLSTLE